MGSLGVETGAFLLTSPGSDKIILVALSGKEGITRQPNLFTVSGKAIDKIFTWAECHDLAISAQLHSHAGLAFLSTTDVRHGFAVEGFTSVIVPRYASPSPNPTTWGWWRYTGKVWCPLAPAELTEGRVTSVTFDERGVRESD